MGRSGGSGAPIPDARMGWAPAAAAVARVVVAVDPRVSVSVTMQLAYQFPTKGVPAHVRGTKPATSPCAYSNVTCWLIQECMSTAAAAEALMLRVEPNWLISTLSDAAASASALSPGPSCPNNSTQRSGKR